MEVRKDFVNNEETIFISSDELKKDIEYVLINKIENIGINRFKGYSFGDIDEIATHLSHVKKLHVECEKMDLSKLYLFKDLEYLSVAENDKLDLSNHTRLRKLAFVYNKSVVGLEKLNHLEELNVMNANSYVYSSIGNLLNLKTLRLSKPNNLSIKDIVSKDCHLQSLEIAYCKDVLDLSELKPIAENVKEIRFDNCKNIMNYTSLVNLSNIEVIVFSDCNAIKDSTFVDSLRTLKQLTVIGKSFFEEGNIDNLKREGLTVGIDSKKHYTLKSNQFLNYFRNPPVPMG